MSQVNVRFRPKVEEFEPRLLPDSYGVWHALLQTGKGFIQDYKALKGHTDPDPFCDGAEPGPCADPAPDVLRSNLQYARGAIAGNLADTLDEIDQVRQAIQNLPHDPQHQAQAIRYQLYLTYLQNYSDRETLGLNDLERLLRDNDNQLLGDAKALRNGWEDALRNLGNLWKGNKNTYLAAVRQRLSTDRIFLADNNLAAAEGAVDADIYDLDILDYYIEQAQ